MSKRSLVVLAALAIFAVAVPAFADAPTPIGTAQHRVRTASAPEFFACSEADTIFVSLAAGHTAAFCDGTRRNAGTSKSCKAWGQANPAAAPSISCPAGSNVANLNCSPYDDRQCASGYGCDCSWDCVKALAVDPVGEI